MVETIWKIKTSDGYVLETRESVNKIKPLADEYAQNNIGEKILVFKNDKLVTSVTY